MPRWFSPRFEPLEQRQLLAAHLLGTIDATLATAFEIDTAPLNVAPVQVGVSGGNAVLGFRMYGTSGTLDPDSVSVKCLGAGGGTADDYWIAPVLNRADVNGGTDSLVLCEVGPGSYSVTVKGEGATLGGYRFEVFMPGDSATIGQVAGQVEQKELLWAQAAAVQSLGSWNYVTQMYYAQYGIDLSKNLYRSEFDGDADGDVDGFDVQMVTLNAGAKVSVQLIQDSTAPVIAAALANDTGRSATDGITKELAISGTVQEQHEVVKFLAGIDGMDRANYVSVLAQVNASGAFQLSQTKLEEIAGGSLANNGTHTLHLIATDEFDNESADYQVTFSLDTIAPAVPTGLDLAAASDLGWFNDDNVTNDNTPTVSVTGETGAYLAIYSNTGGKLGEALAASTVSITATAMANGAHQLTAVASDAAGNESEASTALQVTIDTSAPATPTLALAATDDTGSAGDSTTEKTSVRLEGVAEAGSRVTLNAGTAINADGTTGAFGYDAVALVFGANVFTVTSTDLAGNTSSSFTRTITQNNAPTQGTAVGPIALDEDPGAKSYSLAGLFGDVNLASGDTLTLSIVGNTNPALVTAAVSGTSGQVVNSQLQLAFGANQNGTATLTIRATDSYGETIDTTIVVNVAAVNDAPVTQVGSFSTNEDTPLTIDLWELVGDLETADAQLNFTVNSPSGGTAVLQADGHTVLFTPTAEYHGAAGFSYSVTDTGDGASPAATVGPVAVNITVGAVNDPPTAAGGTATTLEDTAVTVDLRTLVSDKETAVDAMVFAVTGNQNGTATLLADGHTVQFTPAANFNNLRGTASFTYTVTDAGDGSAAAITAGPATVTVSVTPVNDLPTAVNDTKSVANNASTTIQVLANDTDADLVEGDVLSIISFTQGSQGGTVALSGDGKTLVYTPVSLWDGSGTETFTYTIKDSTGAESTATVTVIVLPNIPPVAGDDNLGTTNEDTAAAGGGL
ncbi:MAG TPA: tandem-95 repeat protein, partial [Thermoguttaceae bacterium]|nr:tandem-95 repeat protein [Thermoguttaceae bacterium]